MSFLGMWSLVSLFETPTLGVGGGPPLGVHWVFWLGAGDFLGIERDQNSAYLSITQRKDKSGTKKQFIYSPTYYFPPTKGLIGGGPFKKRC